MPTLDCLKGLVGIKGRDSADSLYIQSLPGISVSDFELVLNNESRSAFARIDELIELAISELSHDVNTALLGKYQLKTFLEGQTVGYIPKTPVIAPAATGNLTGVEIRFQLSPYLKFYLSSLSLFANYTGNVDVLIYDLRQNKLLQTITIPAVAGEIITVPVTFEYLTNKQRMDLFIGYSSTFDSYQLNLTGFSDDRGYTNTWGFIRGVRIPDSAQKLYKNTIANSGTSGLSFDYSLTCTFEPRLCAEAKNFAYPLLYKVGHLMMRESKYSKRLNGVVTAYQDNHDELMTIYGNKYTGEMNRLFQNMSMPGDLCFCETPPAANKIMLP